MIRDIGYPSPETAALLRDVGEWFTSEGSIYPEDAFVREYQGEQWTFTTNGHRLLAIRGNHREDGATGPEKAPEPSKVLDRLSPEPGVSLSLGVLRAFLGIPAADADPCTKCGGRGTVPCTECMGAGDTICNCSRCGDEHETECEECDGDGRLPCPACGIGAKKYGPMDPFLWGDLAFNVSNLAPAIRALPELTVEAVLPAIETHPLALYGEGWFALFMPVRRDAVNDDARRFDPSALATTT